MASRNLKPFVRCVLKAMVVATLLSFSLPGFLRAQPLQPSSSPNAPGAPLGLPAVTLEQHSPDWFDFHARHGELRARLAMHFKERTLSFYPERLPRARGLEWPMFADMAPLLLACLQAAVPDAERMPSFSFCIRLVMYPEMSYRVALHAVASKQWDAAHGRGKGGFTNGLVIKVAKDNDTYPELRALFASRGYRIELVSLEKVLTGRVRELPYRDELTGRGVAPQSLVPYDAILWFKTQRSQ